MKHFCYIDSMPVNPDVLTTGLWVCLVCGTIYDPADGDPDGGIPPGTRFADIPDTWVCPVCGARKSQFVPMRDS